MFRVCGRRPRELSTASLRTFRQFLPAIFAIFQRLMFWVSARRHLLASSLCCHGAFILVSTPGPAHQPCAARGCLERDTSLAGFESITSVMLVAMSLVHVPLRIRGSAALIAFVTWHRRFGSVINLWRSAGLFVSLVLFLLLRFGANLRGMWISVHEIVIQF